MSLPSQPSHSKTHLELGSLLLAAALGLYALWVLTAELTRPTLKAYGKFPPAIAAAAIESSRSMATVAALIGNLRGDLWAERVLVDAEAVLSTANTLTAEQIDAARLAARLALSYAPLDSRVWLVLAALYSGSRVPGQDTYVMLRMSYHTSPNEKSLIEARLRFSIRSQAFLHSELNEAMRREFRTILQKAPELRPSIFNIYREAKPEGKAFIEMNVLANDPTFLAILQRSIR